MTPPALLPSLALTQNQGWDEVFASCALTNWGLSLELKHALGRGSQLDCQESGEWLLACCSSLSVLFVGKEWL